jgi:hypothetical protein
MKIPSLLSSKEKKWAFIALSVAMGALIYGWLVDPIFEDSSKNDGRLRAKKTALKKSFASIAQSEALKADYERTAGHALLSAEQEDVTESLKNLEQIANEYSILLANVNPQIFEGDEDGSRRILFDVSARADVMSFVRFLYRLETSPHLLRVKRFTVSAGSQETEGLQCTLLISELSTR